MKFALVLALSIGFHASAATATGAERCERIFAGPTSEPTITGARAASDSNGIPRDRSSRWLSREAIGSSQLRGVIQRLREHHRRSNAISSIAPSIGVPARIIIVNSPIARFLNIFGFGNRQLVLINPEYVRLGSDERIGLEGCRAPLATCEIASRGRQIRMRYWDESGNVKEITLSDRLAVEVQRQIEALNGSVVSRLSREYQLSSVHRMGRASRASLLRYVETLSSERLSRFKNLAGKIDRDLYLVSEPGSLPHAFSELPGLRTRQAILKELFQYYRIKIEDPENTAAYADWIKSEIHVAFLIEDLSTSGLLTDERILASLRGQHPIVRHLGLNGIRGPPFGDIREIEVPRASGSRRSTPRAITLDRAVDALAFSRALSEWNVVASENGFEATLPHPTGARRLTVATSAELLQLFRASLTDRIDRSSPEFLRVAPYSLNGQRSKRITFGLEAEYGPDVSHRILSDYRPSGVPDAPWLQMSPSERARASAELISRERKNATFVKLAGAPDWLPSTLAGEGNGNFEFNQLIFTSIEDARSLLARLEDRYGRGSYHGHVVFLRDDAFSGVTGYSVFEADFAQLRTLERNFAIYLQNPTFELARNVFHHSLGPLGEADRLALMAAELGVRRGRATNLDRTLKTYAPILRTDAYPEGLVGIELRQFHNRSEELLTSMERLSQELETTGRLDLYKTFELVPLIDRASALSQFRALGFNRQVPQLDHFIDGLTRHLSRSLEQQFHGDVIGGEIEIGERLLFHCGTGLGTPFSNVLHKPSAPMLKDASRARVDRSRRT